MKLSALITAGFGVLFSVVPAAAFETSIDPATVPPVKSTRANLYLSSHDAFVALFRDPDIFLVDVRDPQEISLSGHPEPVDAIVPVRVLTDVMDPETGDYALADNPAFLAQMDSMIARFGLSKSDPIIVTCGSGRRSAEAARRLIDAGYTSVWHIIDGYSGEERPGMNIANAWDLAGLPWTKTKIVPGSAWDSLFQIN